uniref:Uncharacterized protein n=1 Tax=Salix viminalis TaxID=40686 RepID=A0A6N2KH89_SALVM
MFNKIKLDRWPMTMMK